MKEEIHGETLEATTTDGLLTELENELPEAYETPDSVQKGTWMTKYNEKLNFVKNKNRQMEMSH